MWPTMNAGSGSASCRRRVGPRGGRICVLHPLIAGVWIDVWLLNHPEDALVLTDGEGDCLETIVDNNTPGCIVGLVGIGLGFKGCVTHERIDVVATQWNFRNCIRSKEVELISVSPQGPSTCPALGAITTTAGCGCIVSMLGA